VEGRDFYGDDGDIAAVGTAAPVRLGLKALL